MNVSLQNMGTVNKNEVTLTTSNGSITIYFSYQTAVAFELRTDGIVCRENDWAQTTGKLLNELEPDHKARVTGEVFEARLEQALSSL